MKDTTYWINLGKKIAGDGLNYGAEALLELSKELRKLSEKLGEVASETAKDAPVEASKTA